MNPLIITHVFCVSIRLYYRPIGLPTAKLINAFFLAKSHASVDLPFSCITFTVNTVLLAIFKKIKLNLQLIIFENVHLPKLKFCPIFVVFVAAYCMHYYYLLIARARYSRQLRLCHSTVYIVHVVT